jgi:hypothetical protein
MSLRCRNRTIGLVLATLSLGFDASGQDSVKDDGEAGFVSLFDGTSLQGWKRIGGKAEAWRVEDGALVSLGTGGGWLASTRPHANFVLRLEFRLTPESNSGVYLRAPDDNSHISRTGLEIQLLDETHPRYKGIQPWQYTGAIYHVAGPEPGHLRPTGQWNTMEIRAEGPHVVIRLNGTTVVDDRLDAHPALEKEHPGLKRTEGMIGLQSHNGRVEFRRIAIKDLPQPGSPQ